MKIAEKALGQVMGAWVAAAAIAPKLSPIQSFVTKHASRAQETLDAVLEAAEKAPARLVAAAMAGILAFSIGVVELVNKLFG